MRITNEAPLFPVDASAVEKTIAVKAHVDSESQSPANKLNKHVPLGKKVSCKRSVINTSEEEADEGEANLKPPAVPSQIYAADL